MEITPIGKIITPFKTKFAVPRQSGLIENVEGTIIFDKKYSNADPFRGLEEFSHLWIIWGFSENKNNNKFSPTVRPPRLGGNKKVGVFASRSPFRPNSLGLSSVKIKSINNTNNGVTITVTGVDMVSGTPIYDIKPYISYTDCHDDSKCSYADENKNYKLPVEITDEIIEKLPINHRQTVIDILSSDPRPSYQNDENRVYGFEYLNFDIRFKVQNNKIIVVDIKNG